MASQWKSAVDPTTGQTYYFHEVTRETQWRKPMELASDEEKSAMEQKVQKEKDFFAAMEANILSSLSRGVIPGTPSPERQSPKKMEKLQSFRRPSLMRPNDVLPELVRTISTMDETVLQDVIRRQPSIRNIKKGISRREPSLQMDDLRSFSTNTDRSSNGFESWGNSSEFSQYSYQGNLETLKEDAREALAIELDTKIDLQGRGLPNLISGDNTSESLRRGSKPGDPDWKETQALTRLCSLTQEMMNADEDEAKPSKSSPGGRLKKASEGDIGRALPREMDFEDSDFEEEEKPAPLRRKDRAARLVANSDKTAADLVRPAIQRRNTCGTMYIRTTMSAPDKDATIRCVCGVYRSHILSSEHDNLPIDETTAFTVFNDYPEGAMKRQNHGVPSLDEVTTFYRDVFFKAQMEADCVIMSLIYVERLIKKTIGKLRPRANNWRSLLFSCMILSSKVWDDLSMWNGDFSQSCPPGGVNFCLQRTNQLELAILNTLKFNVKVPASEYAKYYFLLRSMLIKSGLGGEDLGSLNPLDVEGARRLQQVSSQFESRSLAKPASLSNFQRSKSLSVQSNRDATPLKHPKTKLGLEQVVKMS